MDELTHDEIFVLRNYFAQYGISAPHYRTRIVFALASLSFHDAESAIDSLVNKQVLSLSPDRNQVRLTDFGLELFESVVNAQQEWESRPFISISTSDRDQVLICAGETFRANRILRDIFHQASRELLIVDPYLGASIFDLLEDSNPALPTKLLTSDSIKAAMVQAYHAFAQQYPGTELRIAPPGSLHDRFILWDGQHAAHLGHSLKDLGTKDTQITVVQNAQEQYSLFDQRWSVAVSPK